jgi:hypothetical protein
MPRTESETAGCIRANAVSEERSGTGPSLSIEVGESGDSAFQASQVHETRRSSTRACCAQREWNLIRVHCHRNVSPDLRRHLIHRPARLIDRRIRVRIRRRIRIRDRNPTKRLPCHHTRLLTAINPERVRQ